MVKCSLYKDHIYLISCKERFCIFSSCRLESIVKCLLSSEMFTVKIMMFSVLFNSAQFTDSNDKMLSLQRQMGGRGTWYAQQEVPYPHPPPPPFLHVQSCSLTVHAQSNLPFIRTPLYYYGQFTWSPSDRNPYKAYFSKMDTSII